MEDNSFEDDVPAIPDKKTLVLVNTFIIQTVGLLNRFSLLCERKLEAVNRSVKRVDVQLQLLESKLRSVEGLDRTSREAGTSDASKAPAVSSHSISLPDVTSSAAGGNSDANNLPPPPPAPPPHLPQQPGTNPPPAEALQAQSHSGEATSEGGGDFLKVKDHPELGKFFRMERMGVPSQAVKNRMTMEGHNPDLLDNPNAPAPG
mmetsp:Transcript_24700/g.34051  ORF Transcript_24700/g.34051 Transcript_24700/m.34051 type:complete len:204 (-) Transcript_24700:87-698(-)|eukprot:CAMPEP_0196595060 /NCGR_PEP_ID=MMETSP1081-20130531/80037_1 /TAXON_ID=36882 /ORGANISM="Pyramimonas amylifera, Strain CCMP720" /LENGTH=203 /DNA_ID=CAMNT_0041919507 /DNA_START=163 /DNA_END=774 /DNA_ORIENTATION=-